MGSQEVIKIEDDFILIRFQNDENEPFHVEKQISQGLIQFHFGIKGKAKFIFNQGNYTLDLKEEKALLLYNPQKELPLNLILEPQTWVISVIISIKKFHALFSTEASYIPFLSGENQDKKYYNESDISPSMAIVLSQLFHYNLHPNIKNLYYKGKGYELLSLYFNRSEDPNAEQCPFLIDEDNVFKIKKAKETEYKVNVEVYGKFTADCLKEGIIKPGMNGTAVLLVLGTPTDLIERETKSGFSSHLVYENMDVFIENNIVSSIVKRKRIR